MPARTIAVDPELEPARVLRGASWAVRPGDDGWWWATRTPDGPGSLRLQRAGGRWVEAEAWGPGAAWLLEQAPRLLGTDDDLTGWQPDGELDRLWRRRPDPLPRTDRLWDALVAAVLGQKVQATLARRSFAAMARRLGEPAPGPCPMAILPPPAVVAGAGYAALHPLGVERKRAEVLRRAARELPRLEAHAGGPAAPLPARLRAVPGIGPWTAALVTAEVVGDPDAVPVGDLHLPHLVSWALAGEPRGTDERMLELLAPYAGHRWRVLRLLRASGISAPRYAHRLSLVDGGLQRGR